jgi:alanine-glyoxylate transaminase/serine-glyoxylate transaminase/serine-pyruvate transaminase
MISDLGEVYMSAQNPIFIPGPTNTPDRLRQAMQGQNIDHRSPEFADLIIPLLDGLRPVFGSSDAATMIFPATGTAGWEAVVSNLLSAGDRVLMPRYGVFSARWIELCHRHGLLVDVIDCAWGDGVPVAQIEARLAADHQRRIKAVLITHNETTTGVRADLEAVRAAMDATSHPAMLFADAVSSLASIDFRMDEWRVDAVVAGSQKGFMLNPGLAIIALSQKALAQMPAAGLYRSFFSIADMLAATRDGGYPYTPPTQLLYGLRESLAMLQAEGLANVYARHDNIAEGVRKAVAAWGLSLVARDPSCYSNTVSAVYVPADRDAARLNQHMAAAYGVSVGVGLGQLQGKSFRIGHLGALTRPMMLSGLATLEMAMLDLGYPIELGSGVAAAQTHYREGDQSPNSTPLAA